MGIKNLIKTAIQELKADYKARLDAKRKHSQSTKETLIKVEIAITPEGELEKQKPAPKRVRKKVTKTKEERLQDSIHKRHAKRFKTRMIVNSIIGALHAAQSLYKDELVSFYEYRNLINDLTDITTSLKKERITPKQMELTKRLWGRYHTQGLCNNTPSDSIIKSVVKWKYGENGEEGILLNTLHNYEEYWNDVLESYVLQNAKIKRLEYLINNLEEFKRQPYIRTYYRCVRRMTDLQNQYKKRLKAEIKNT